MAISLQKGQKIDIGLSNISVGLGWNPAEGTGATFDLDASAFLIDSTRQIPSEPYFVFYGMEPKYLQNGEIISPDGAVHHTGDDPDGSGSESDDDDKETIRVNLTKVSPVVQEILFVVTIHEAAEKRQNFGQVRDSYIRIVDNASGNEIAKYELGEDFSIETAIEFGRLYRKDGKWKFEASGIGYKEDLAFFLQQILQRSNHQVITMAINLSKGGDKHAINLSKTAGTGQSLLIHANLNWSQEKKGGFLSFLSAKADADLDLGCMYEMADGTKGVIQPLGKSFGSKTTAPYIFLDKDDRDGGSSDGENMHVYKPELIKRILFFGLIYAGAKDFNSVNGRMFFKISNGDEVSLQLDNAGANKPFCAAAMIENKSGELTIRKEGRYFNGHSDADAHYNFGFSWKQGSKD